MSTALAPTARPDTAEMVMVHNAFRRHLSALPDLVAQVDAADTTRARRLVDFMKELVSGLHHHHTGEDELMWPILLERAPGDAALIERMEEQHERIAGLMKRADREAEAFAETADTVARDHFAATLRLLSVALDEHLDEEERRILPVVEEVMTVAEWEHLAENGRAHMSKERQLVFLGYILHGAPAADGKKFLSVMPLPARLAWRFMGRRAYGKEYREIYGTAPQW
ncbi:hemerythrin domain-containing protein [Nocardia higoensis]|uniref:hemerythrin domain-containing protein n=1 Tax=Nocardia higoensis TaxID=228599 RepID=UPI00030B4DCC|nr:hemerythrin domain-containing protein [Nocardia higoensis]